MAYWDEQHDKYAETYWIDKPSLFAQWAIDHFPQEGSVLDLGAGQAQDSRYFDENGYDVTATDFSDHALELAKQKSSASIKLQKVDSSEPLPFADQSYDAVYAHLSLHYFDKETTEKIFADIHRVLKVGGLLVALFNSAEDPEISEGKEIESNFIDLHGVCKRYFSPSTAQSFAKDFEVIVADSKGTTYKDREINVNNLVRLVARKS